MANVSISFEKLYESQSLLSLVKLRLEGCSFPALVKSLILGYNQTERKFLPVVVGFDRVLKTPFEGLDPANYIRILAIAWLPSRMHKVN